MRIWISLLAPITLLLALRLVHLLVICRSRKFRLALPGYRYLFPRDHYAHKEFHTEWWYHVGHLTTADGAQFGYELTFFRRAITKNPLEAFLTWRRSIYFAHFALTDKSGKRFASFQRINTRPLYPARTDETRLSVLNGIWSLRGKADKYRLKADALGYGLNLQLVPSKPPVVHGSSGVSQKADGVGRSSHYISVTRSQTAGTITFAGVQYAVSGISWMDHEFGTNQLTDLQVGWDWFCLQLDNDMDIMIYLMRNSDGAIDHNSSGTIVYPDGTTLHIRCDEFAVQALGKWKSPKSGGVYPMGWIVKIPRLNIELKIQPIMEDQELVATSSKGVSYWEGASEVVGRMGDEAVTGKSYTELIGYAEPVPRDL